MFRAAAVTTTIQKAGFCMHFHFLTKVANLFRVFPHRPNVGDIKLLTSLSAQRSYAAIAGTQVFSLVHATTAASSSLHAKARRGALEKKGGCGWGRMGVSIQYIHDTLLHQEDTKRSSTYRYCDFFRFAAASATRAARIVSSACAVFPNAALAARSTSVSSLSIASVRPRR